MGAPTALRNFTAKTGELVGLIEPNSMISRKSIGVEVQRLFTEVASNICSEIAVFGECSSTGDGDYVGADAADDSFSLYIFYFCSLLYSIFRWSRGFGVCSTDRGCSCGLGHIRSSTTSEASRCHCPPKKNSLSSNAMLRWEKRVTSRRTYEVFKPLLVVVGEDD